jgi:PhoPQ-activated pathogenicity-related protein
LVLVVLLPATLAWDWDVTTPLDEYVAREDPGLPAWEKIDEYDMSNRGCIAHVINFTSQIWKDESVSSQPVWFHYLLVFVPLEGLTIKDAGMMFIEGGSNNRPPPGEDNEFAIILCRAANITGASTSLLRMIPNQPIRYPDDPSGRNRTEDANIAWTWKKMIDDPSDPEIALQFPMTKSAVKALDVHTDVVQELVDPASDVQKYTIAGGSKRGWITWLLACVDRRVQVAAPVVLTVLNMVPSLHKHWESLGGWTYVFNDYYEVNITAKLDDPNTAELALQVDPMSYKERLTMPKVVMCATGDEFFLLDDSHMFFHDLPEPKYMMLVENTNHGMIGAYTRLANTLTAMFLTMQEDNGVDLLPKLSWTRFWIEPEAMGEITMTVRPESPPLLEAEAWWADTPHDVRRDWRMTTRDGLSGVLWRRWHNGSNGTFTQLDDYTWRLTVPESTTAPYRAMLVNGIFEGPREDIPFEFTTEAQVVPDTFPFDPCTGEACYGDLV